MITRTYFEFCDSWKIVTKGATIRFPGGGGGQEYFWNK